MMDVTPIKRRKLYQDIVERIEASIRAGDYRPGDRLPPERELMQAYQVGRTSVREALFALQKMGLVSINSGEAPLVTQPTPKAMVDELSGVARHMLSRPEGVRHFQQARAFLEVGLVRYAAEHRTDGDLDALRAALDANRAAIGRPEQFGRTDVAFHYALSRVPHNPIFDSLHAALVEWLTEQRATSIQARGSAQAAFRAHERIFDAIAARNPDAAADAMQDHLDEVGRQYWSVLKRK